ncbi:MAG: M20/M25/M40 family metallo-hydrolase [Planctomycetota bacterium]|nr:M20/M25/M40 family metallo-hydrolase [Planctomycetota bacterium]
MTEVSSLLSTMVATQSVSGNEAALQADLASWLRDHGIEPILSGRNLWARRGNPEGPRILLNSHLDTVPPSPDWKGNPWSAHEEEGWLVGLGSNDAKGSGAAMLCAFARLSDNVLAHGEIVLALTCDEETGGEGLERLIHDLPPIDAGIVGEPTDLRPAICQRGLLKLRLVAQGQAGHASRPHEGDNAIHKAARAIVALEETDLGPPHPLLGTATVQVTLTEGGTKSNVLPAYCEATMDCRTTPAMHNERLLHQIRERASEVKFETISNRIGPIETEPDAAIVRSAISNCPEQPQPIAFGGVSDRFWLGSTPSVVLGPGLSRWSHQAGERIQLTRVEQAVTVYQNLVSHWFTENKEGP